MDYGIIEYCLQQTPFFDVATSADRDYDLVTAPLQEDWIRITDPTWCYQNPLAVETVEQGWKIHVSAHLKNDEKVLRIVAGLCFERNAPFKFLRSATLLAARNSKYADRTSSGKFIAIYPQSEEALATLLEDLELQLAGFDGPSILTDLRYAAAPVFVRYGGFVELFKTGPDGGRVHCIRRPDGVLVPDLRRPSFTIPDWVTVPDCLQEPMRQRREGATRLPFRVVRALHFSNGGGVYQALDPTTGQPVLLKEARPGAGLDEVGNDAVTRLERERWALAELAGAPYIPRLLDYRRGNQHYFLAREFVDGESLLTTTQTQHPYLPGARTMAPREYAQWALSVGNEIDEALTDMHARGVAFGDVHPNNVLLVGPQSNSESGRSRIAFIDLETATPTAEDVPQRIGAPGFRAPAHLRGVAADRYGLACLRLALFLPATITLTWDVGQVYRLLAEIHDRFDDAGLGSVVPLSFDDAVLADLGHPERYEVTDIAFGSSSSALPAALELSTITAFTLSVATPERTDRLYPGAARLFTAPAGSVSFAYGAAGVVWTLSRLGHVVPDDHLEWLCEHATRVPPTSSIGLFEGTAGVALALDELEFPEIAEQLWDRSLEVESTEDQRGNHSLTRGKAGLALAALRSSSRRPELAKEARRIGSKLLADRSWESMTTLRDTPAWGLTDGPSGLALLFVRLFETGGSTDYLDGARAALACELDRLFEGHTWSVPGATCPPGPWQRATIHRGSAGTAMVLRELLEHVDDPTLMEPLSRLNLAHDGWHFEHPGLFTGRAGMIAALRHVGSRWPNTTARIATQERLLQLHEVRVNNVAGYLGDHGLKMSCDVASGSTGVGWVRSGGTIPFCFADPTPMD